MSGWSKAKRERTERAFYEFLDNCFIYSKDSGYICLGKELYDGQRKFITEVFDALEADVHDIYVLKSRQLGISTIARALVVFLIGIFDGVTGAIVFDTDPNKQRYRQELNNMVGNFAAKYKFPQIDDNNRYGLTWRNKSSLLLMAAGVRKSKTSGTLGRSVGVSIAHMSEICSYDDVQGLEAFEQSLSDTNPDRLYIRESTARGPNIWHDMWTDARKDTLHCRCLFLGWWSKPSQRIDRDHPEFAKYGMPPPSELELKRIKAVKERYGHDITPEQLAWIRRKMDPLAEKGDDDENLTRLQEQPWLEEEAFQMTGSVFFPPQQLTLQMNKYVQKVLPTNCYSFMTGIEFTDMKVYKAHNAKSIELKVWEEPQANQTYVLSADVAFGSNEHSDRSSFQVLRCYADGMDQVAEYAWPLIGSKQYAWVILATAAWYAADGSEVFLIIELNGPGRAVWDEIEHLRHHIARGYQPREVAEKGFQNIFRNVKNFIYHRNDSFTGGRAWHWQTNAGAGPSGKVRLMERLRDFISTEKVHLRSLDTLGEMQGVTRDGDTIKSEGRKKDDRVVALALGVRCFEDRVQRKLSNLMRTRENEAARMTLSVTDRVRLFSQFQFQHFLEGQRRGRIAQAREARRQSWRGR